MTVKTRTISGPVINTDTLTWSNQYGGDWATAANWTDITSGTTATAAPGVGNTVSITGGVGSFTNIVGSGAVAQLTITNDVILWGTSLVGGAITVAANNTYPTSDLELDGNAVLSGASLNLQSSSTLQVSGGSRLTISGNATLTNSYLSAMSGSTLQLGGLILNNGTPGYYVIGDTFAVDDNSSIEIGSSGNAASGAVTIDKSQNIAFAGVLDGNVVVNGTISIEGGGGLIIGAAPANGSMGLPALSSASLRPLNTVTGSGTIRLSENSTLMLAATDSAAIQFTAPLGKLLLGTFGQTGTISGFAATDIIETAAGLATGVTAAETTSATRLTFTNGSTTVGTLTLAGNYIGSLFHFSRGSTREGYVTLQTVGSAPAVPSLILGTTAFDMLTATANNQTLTGLGGGDMLSAGAFTGIDFKDTSINLNGVTIQSIGTTGIIDLTDMSLAKATVTFVPAASPVYNPSTSPTLTIADGTHTATVAFAAFGPLPIGYFSTSTDGATGTDVKYVTVNTDAYRYAAQAGGSYSSAGNWTDVTTGNTATTAPGAGNAVSIAGGSAGFTTITGNGVAASLAISGDVALSGSIAIVSLLGGPPGGLTQSGTLALNNGASLALPATGSLGASVCIGGTIQVSGASRLSGAGSIALTQTGAALQVTGGSTAQFAALSSPSTSLSSTPVFNAGTIRVDSTSSIEFGTSGNAQKGAVSFDAGVTGRFFGTIQGNVVLNGTLIEAGSTLSIGGFATASASVTGAGTLAFGGANETLQLTGSDSASIQFAGANDILALGTILPTGTIGGFALGDTIAVAETITSFRYNGAGSTGGILTLLNGSANVGTLALSGTYTTNQFLVQPASDGRSSTLSYLPGPIVGTPGFDILTATANNETLSGLGGNDLLSAATFTGINFKDTSTNLNGSTIQAFGATDVIDLMDMSLARAAITYTQGAFSGVLPNNLIPPSLMVTDGTHTVSVTLGGFTPPAPGYFATSSDNGAGTNVSYVVANTDAYTFVTQIGGSYSAAGNWTDITTAAAVPPGVGNNVTISGASAGYTNVTGNGVARNLTTTGDVLIWGSISTADLIGGASGTLTQSGTLTLDGGASLSLRAAGGSGANALIGGTVELAGGSRLTSTSGLVFTQFGAALQVTGGSSAQFAALAGAPTSLFVQTNVATIGMDATSSIEFGTAGNAQKGALTIDAGVTAQFLGSIAGNIVLNGTLIAPGNGVPTFPTTNALSISGFATANTSITGSGTLAFGGNFETVQLSGSDSAAIQFSGTSDILALGSILPTGVISGFATSDAITLMQTVTNARYSQGATSGTLTLLNGLLNVGSLVFAGTYAANQFQVQLAPNGQSSLIVYLPTPSTVLGNQVSTNSDAYSWSAANGGDWTNANNWSDTTSGTVPSVAPGSGNAVMFSSTTLNGQIISGSGSVASLSAAAQGAALVFTGNASVIGSFTVTASSGWVDLTSGAKFRVGNLNDYGALQLAAGSVLTVSGQSGFNYISGTLDVIGGGSVAVYSGAGVAGSITIDGSSTVEFGNTGGVVAGALTIDSGVMSAFNNGATIAANMIVNGAVSISGAQSPAPQAVTIEGFAGTTGTITGSGTIALSGGSHLVLDSADSVTIAFLPFANLGTLELGGPLPTGTISGYGISDIIQVDQTVTGLSYSQTTALRGTLTLLNGSATIGKLNLAGNYTGDLFHVDVAAATGFATISLLTQPSSNGSSIASTGKDAYSWQGTSIGGWSAAANWRDATTNTTPTAAPESSNAVTIAGTGLTTIGGNGSASSLTDTGNLFLTGQVNVAGQLTVGVPLGLPARLALDAGAQFTAASATIIGQLQAGGGSSATVTGTAIVATGTILALNGSAIRLGGLIGNNDILAVDATSTVTVGSVALPSLGALNQASGSTVALSGAIYGSVVANGVLSVAGGAALAIDLSNNAEYDPYQINPSITGTGTLSLGENSLLSLGVADSVAIQFAGPNATLALAKLPSAIISGFAVGEQIQVDQPVTGLAYVQTGSNLATLTLTNGANTIGTLKLAGNFGAGGNAFHLEATGTGSAAVISLQSLGLAQTQPTLIQGTAAADVLTATANGQTLIGLGGGDLLNGASFTGISFRDLTANLNGSMIQHFAATDILDFTDLKSSSASAVYNGTVLTVSDGTRSASLNFTNLNPSGSLHTSGDGASGTKLIWAANT